MSFEQPTGPEKSKEPEVSPRNLEIFKEIQDGNFSNISQLTFITPLIAESLSKHKGDLDLSKMTRLDASSELLLKNAVDINPPEITTPPDDEGWLDLSKLTTLPDDKGHLDLSKLTALPDDNYIDLYNSKLAKPLSDDKEDLVLNSIIKLSDPAVERISKLIEEGKFYPLDDDAEKKSNPLS